jgi:hypothetical protein
VLVGDEVVSESGDPLANVILPDMDNATKAKFFEAAKAELMRHRQRDIGKVPPGCAGLAQLVKFGVELCSRFLGEVLQFSEQVLVGFAVPVDKQSCGLVTLAALSDGIPANEFQCTCPFKSRGAVATSSDGRLTGSGDPVDG